MSTQPKPDLSPRDPQVFQADEKFECMACGRVWEEDTKTCAECGGNLRLNGPFAEAVRGEWFASPRQPPAVAPGEGAAAINAAGRGGEPAGPPPSGDTATIPQESPSRRVEDMSASSETERTPRR